MGQGRGHPGLQAADRSRELGHALTSLGKDRSLWESASPSVRLEVASVLASPVLVTKALPDGLYTLCEIVRQWRGFHA